MSFKSKLTPVAISLALVAGFSLPTAVMAGGGGSGPAVQYVAPGKIGEIVVNPYKIAPLTAIIKNGGYELLSATVRVVPKGEQQGPSHLCRHSGVRPLPRLQQQG